MQTFNAIIALVCDFLLLVGLLTGVVTATEFSDDYPMVLPLITAVAMTTGLSHYLGWDSLYLAQMRLRNEEYHAPDISTG